MPKLFAVALFVVSLTLSSVAFAEPQAQDASPPQDSSATASEPLVVKSKDTPSDGARYLVEAGGGVLYYVGGTILGTIAGLIVGASVEGANTWSSLAYAGAGGVAGGYIALPAGVFMGGEAYGGEGSLGASYLGGLGGLAVAAGTIFLAAQSDNDTVITSAVMVSVALPLLGSMIGYEMSIDDPALADETAGAVLMPSVGSSRDGGFTIGIGAAF